MTKRSRKLIIDALRIGICLAALWFVLRGVTLRDRITLADGRVLEGAVLEEQGGFTIELASGERRTLTQEQIGLEGGAPKITYGLASAWHRSQKGLLILAVGLYFPVAAPLAQRFRMLLRVQDIHLTFRESLRLTFAGNFLNFTTPLGSNAGDVFKAYFASLHTPHKTEAVTTVVLDRIIGLAILLVVAASITVAAPSQSRLADLRPYMLFLLLGGVAGTAIYFSPIARRFPIPDRLRQGAYAQQLKRMDKAVRQLARRPGTLLASVFLTLSLQLLALTAYLVAAIALSMHITMYLVPEYFAYFYAGAIIQALPGPPQGLGTVELAYRHFFAPYGSPSQIICLALATRLVALVASLPGLFVALTGSYKPKDAEKLVNDSSSNSTPALCAGSEPGLIGSPKAI